MLPISAVRCLIVALVFCIPALAQRASLRGHVTDESGAIVPGATLQLRGPSTATTAAANDGAYLFAGLPPGDYTLTASAPQLALRRPAKISLRASPVTLDLVLYISTEKQEVTVEENTKPTVSTDASSNASAVVLRGADLDALSDSTDDLAADLQALAGPAAGPNGGSILIDGFSGGELPPKNSIREIRINQNPFSPEYDKLGLGRIEIFTKPGSDRFHGDLGYNFATDKWNSRNPYAAQKAPFHLHELRDTVSGPLGKRASFNLNFVREWVDNGNVVNAVTLDPQTLQPVNFTDTPLAELRRTGVTPRLDYQLTPNHTLALRYSYNRDIVRDAGTGGLNLESRGYHNDARSQTVQITETAVLRTSLINETRFQFFRPDTVAQANSPGAAVQVLGAFNGGGNPIGSSSNSQNNFELQNNTSVLRGAHAWRFGIRVRSASETSVSRQNFNGTFTFSGGLDFSSIESYQQTLLGFPGSGPSQFTMAAGNPLIEGSQFDLGVFAGDDWKLRPNLTVSLGLRYETQNNIGDRRDFAPRIGVAWAPGGSAKTKSKTVVRVGFGIFYDRFALGNTLTARRYNGIEQQQYVVANPAFFPAVPPASSLGGAIASGAIQRISPALRAPYLMQTAVALERQLPFNTTAALTYANSHGLHLLRSQDINAPIPGTGIYPLGRPGLVALMESSGLYNQNQIILNVNSKLNRDVSLQGSYGYGHAMSNTDGLGTFPAKPYSMEGEYAPAAIDVRHRVSLGGTITAKWGVRFNPLLTANSGPPFDITSGQDIYGDTLFNARPAFASDPRKPGVVLTAYGLLDPNPSPQQTPIPRNFGRGPGQIMLNMRIGRTFSLREKGLTVSMQIRNLTNHNNPGPIIGNITSPLFGQANQPAGSGSGIFSESANNRRLEVQTRFTF